LLAVAFLIRLMVAVIISVGLPAWGYDNPVNNAGYLYSDAYDRDHAAYKLAAGTEPLSTAFSHPDISDQYGGLLFISAAVYRTLSPDVDRPLLISLLAAFSMALGLAFFWAALQKRWTLKVAALAAWILALFPDSVFLGSSQMREPFLIALVCIAFWAVLGWRQKPVRSALVALLSVALACVISLPAGGVFIALLAAVFVLEWSLSRHNSLYRWFGLGLLALLGLASVVAGWMWLRSTLYYDSFSSMQQSGWIQELLRHYGMKWMIPLTSIYGLIQPVLPAAFTDPGLPIWQVIAVLRALGWYAALPFLLFGFFAVWKAKSSESKWLLVLFSLVFLSWVAVSSMRAGGDQWDNPRYRYMLLPFMSLLIAWSLAHFQQTRTPWFWRWIAVIAEFTVLLTNTYLNRYFKLPTYISFVPTIALSLIIAFFILAGGWLWDVLKRHTPNSLTKIG